MCNVEKLSAVANGSRRLDFFKKNKKKHILQLVVVVVIIFPVITGKFLGCRRKKEKCDVGRFYGMDDSEASLNEKEDSSLFLIIYAFDDSCLPKSFVTINETEVMTHMPLELNFILDYVSNSPISQVGS